MQEDAATWKGRLLGGEVRTEVGCCAGAGVVVSRPGDWAKTGPGDFPVGRILDLRGPPRPLNYTIFQPPHLFHILFLFLFLPHPILTFTALLVCPSPHPLLFFPSILVDDNPKNVFFSQLSRP